MDFFYVSPEPLIIIIMPHCHDHSCWTLPSGTPPTPTIKALTLTRVTIFYLTCKEKMSSFKKRQKTLKRAHKERSQASFLFSVRDFKFLISCVAYSCATAVTFSSALGSVREAQRLCPQGQRLWEEEDPAQANAWEGTLSITLIHHWRLQEPLPYYGVLRHLKEGLVDLLLVLQARILIYGC